MSSGLPCRPPPALSPPAKLGFIILLAVVIPRGDSLPQADDGGSHRGSLYCDWDLALRYTNPLAKQGFAAYKYTGEVSPILFELDSQDNTVVVCRTPKVGSLLIRSMAVAHADKEPYKTQKNRDVRHLTHANVTVALKGPVEGYRLLNSVDGVTRLMFVRHPVERILAGYVELLNPETAAKGSVTDKSDQFETWLNKFLAPRYSSRCTSTQQLYSFHGVYQHYLPAQHCRCGMPCGVDWQFFKTEEHDISEVLSKHVPDLPRPDSEVVHHNEYIKEDFLTPAAIATLNDMTRTEREFFGYAEYKLHSNLNF